MDINTGTLTLDAALTTSGGGTVTVTNSGLADLNAQITSAGTVLFDDATVPEWLEPVCEVPLFGGMRLFRIISRGASR